MDPSLLIDHNTKKAIKSLNLLNSIGLSPSGFNRLLSARIYSQFIRPQMEYRLAIQILNTKTHTKVLTKTQTTCLRRIYGSSSKTSSSAVMQHLVDLPTMASRVSVLQAKFLNRIRWLPDDALLTQLLPQLTITPHKTQYQQLKKTKLWKSLPSQTEPYDKKQLKIAINNMYDTALTNHRNGNKAKLLRACRDTRGVDPIVFLPMTYRQRSRLIRWRLGWMPNGRPDVTCNNCNNQNHLSRQHVIYCLNAHIRLKVPYVVLDPISFKLNALPKSRPHNPNKRRYWINFWNQLTQLMFDIDALCHGNDIFEPDPIINKTTNNDFVLWLEHRPIPQPVDTIAPPPSTL